jgi:hypothetical protein
MHKSLRNFADTTTKEEPSDLTSNSCSFAQHVRLFLQEAEDHAGVRSKMTTIALIQGGVPSPYM